MRRSQQAAKLRFFLIQPESDVDRFYFSIPQWLSGAHKAQVELWFECSRLVSDSTRCPIFGIRQ